MDDHAYRLVDGDQVLVFEEDVEGDVLRLEVDLWGQREADLDLIAHLRGLPFFQGLSVDKDAAFLDQVLEVGSRKLRKMQGQQLIETEIRLFRGNNKNIC